ncbi:MAG: pantoate--beta-alanine ligase [Verrucomicrobiota bacterium]|nr:pantoate--beta-alanine ligase [Verrucomicrobiota bacterium]
MKTITSPQAMQKCALAWRHDGLRVVLVPTMGALHAGHAGLIRRARKLAGTKGLVVVSIYVNPAQFNDALDLRDYPRTLARDKKLCRAEGVNVVFAPSEMYAPDASVFVEETAVVCGMEGDSRPGHFRGVATIVVKLFNLVMPEVAVFGEKDWQQTTLLKRVVRDLDLSVLIKTVPTVREPDGLAVSSRNVRLNGSQRSQAAVLWQAIGLARKAVRSGSLRGLKQKVRLFIEKQPEARVEYVEFFDGQTMKPAKPQRGVRMALAVYIGKTRLIDNARI